MAGLVLQAEVVGQAVETARPYAFDQAARQQHGTKPGAVEGEVARPAHLGAHEAPVEGGVVGHEDASGQGGEHLVGDLREARRVAHHLVADVGDGTDGGRDRPAGVHQQVQHDLAPVAMYHDHCDLGDPIARAGPHTGGLHIDDRKGAVIQHR